MIDVRFQTALQLMLSLALAQREGITRLSSAQLAEGVGSNPTLVRRQLAPLLRDKLVAASMGREGGIALARDAASITIAEVYRSVMDGRDLWGSRTDVPHRCVVSCNIGSYFGELSTAVDDAIVERLGGETLAAALQRLEELDAIRAA